MDSDSSFDETLTPNDIANILPSNAKLIEGQPSPLSRRLPDSFVSEREQQLYEQVEWLEVQLEDSRAELLVEARSHVATQADLNATQTDLNATQALIKKALADWEITQDELATAQLDLEKTRTELDKVLGEQEKASSNHPPPGSDRNYEIEILNLKKKISARGQTIKVLLRALREKQVQSDASAEEARIRKANIKRVFDDQLQFFEEQKRKIARISGLE